MGDSKQDKKRAVLTYSNLFAFEEELSSPQRVPHGESNDTVLEYNSLFINPSKLKSSNQATLDSLQALIEKNKSEIQYETKKKAQNTNKQLIDKHFLNCLLRRRHLIFLATNHHLSCRVFKPISEE